MQPIDLKLRVSAAIKDWLKSRALTHRRTMNAEILTILDRAMQADKVPPEPENNKKAA